MKLGSHNLESGVRGKARRCRFPLTSAIAVLPAAVRFALLLEAIRAIDWLVAAWYERHLGLFAARCADRSMHLARTTAIAIITAAIAVAIARGAPATTARLASLAAGLAARRLIR